MNFRTDQKPKPSLLKYALVQFIVVFVLVGLVSVAIFVPLAARDGEGWLAFKELIQGASVGALLYSMVMTFFKWISRRL